MSLPETIPVPGDASIPLELALKITNTPLTAILDHLDDPAILAPSPLRAYFRLVRNAATPLALGALSATSE